MHLDRLPAKSWLSYGLGWESRRLSPIVEHLDPDAPVPSFEQFLELVQVTMTLTPAMTACHEAAGAEMVRLRGDDVLRQRFAEHGVEHLNVTPAFVDPGWEPAFVSPRYKFKRAKRFLDVDAWYIYTGPVESEVFGSWVHEHVRADLEGWLQKP